jgi:hypothetical protein
MAGYRFWLQNSLSVVVALMLVQLGQAQTGLPPTGGAFGSLSHLGTSTQSIGSTCKVYSLADLGDDPNLCKWLAETLPEVVQPGSWKQNGVKLSYYAPAKVLVINHSPAVHAQVDDFLQSLKKSLPQQKGTAKAPMHFPPVMQAQFAVPDGARPMGAVQTGPSGYPVPAAPQTPKHLFHFIIRYEGEGIIDSNVVKLAKAVQDKAASVSNAISYAAAVQPNATVVGAAFSPSPLSVPAPSASALNTPSGPPVMPPADAPSRSASPPPLPAAPTVVPF